MVLEAPAGSLGTQRKAPAMNPGRILSNLSGRLEHLLAYVLATLFLVGSYQGCLLLARTLIATGWFA